MTNNKQVVQNITLDRNCNKGVAAQQSNNSISLYNKSSCADQTVYYITVHRYFQK